MVSVVRDITDRKTDEERLVFLAFHDSLTGLPNRAALEDRLRTAIADSRRHNDLLALAYIDLDHFKPINDLLGHALGDRLLVAVAERLRAAVRRTDIVARLGGDEFAVLQTGLRDPDAGEAARKLLHTVGQPFVLDGKMVSVTASIGIAIYPLDGDLPQELLNKADSAMYRAKSQGRNRYQFHA